MVGCGQVDSREQGNLWRGLEIVMASVEAGKGGQGQHR
jgi:hypothetical protein